MFFRYEPDTPSDVLEPRDVYARVDQIEATGDADDSPSLVLLDCIDAEWLDNNAKQGDHLSDVEFEEADRRISIVSISSCYFGGGAKNDGKFEEWYHLKLGDPDGDNVAEQFHNLFQDPTERGVIDVRPVTRSKAEMLNELAGWQGIEATPQSHIEKILSRIGSIDAVAIYDVGQGSATALLSCGVPALYFDFGGSVIGNWRSFPEPLCQFCITAQPPIVLSHWDWDHWSSALRDRRALKLPWIMPIQDKAGALGAVHSRFLATLRASGADICWWSRKVRAIDSLQKDITLFRAHGSKKSRNESGLALSIVKNNLEVLLPGDASIANLWPYNSHLDYLMVPHHGGRTDLVGIPCPNNRQLSRHVYSYGIGNSYCHPLPKTVRKLRRSWKKSAHTALRNSSGLGHVGIDLLQRSQPSKLPPCGNCMCQLGIGQWI